MEVPSNHPGKVSKINTVKVTESFNVATTEENSVKDMANIALNVLEKDMEVKFDITKPDGQYRKDVDSSKLLRVLGDFKFTSLEEGIRRVYDNFSKRYD